MPGAAVHCQSPFQDSLSRRVDRWRRFPLVQTPEKGQTAMTGLTAPQFVLIHVLLNHGRPWEFILLIPSTRWHLFHFCNSRRRVRETSLRCWSLLACRFFCCRPRQIHCAQPLKLTADYGGDGNYLSATGTASVTVTAVPPGFTIGGTPMSVQCEWRLAFGDPVR